MINLKSYEKIKNENALNNHLIRIFTQIDYAIEINKFSNNKYEKIINQAIKQLADDHHQNKCVTIKSAKKAEEMLIPLEKVAKQQTVYLVAHGHLDMNWQWGYDETVAITTSTIETMLDLLDLFPNFTFSQSQTAVFEILEKYRPDLLNRVKEYVKNRRFEITAGAWVECDKNMPSGESLIRQIQLTRQYMKRVFNLDYTDLLIDFQPDTFGHNQNVPDILKAAGIKYYYHCRGVDQIPIFKWESKANNQILVYREPKWYIDEIKYDAFLHVPDFCNRYGLNKVLKVYGVGNHGGGATIRDINRIMEMQTFPIMPKIVFGRYDEFFKYLDTLDNIKVVRGDLNPVFTGCYTSESLIKDGNAEGERFLYQAEYFQSIAGKETDNLEEAWKKILFNQFHDILPGSGKKETLFHALGLYQEAKAITGSISAKAIRDISCRINTDEIFKTDFDFDDISTGAGVGYHSQQNVFIKTVGSGKERAFVIFNQLGIEQKKVIEIPIWDYFYEINDLEAFDSSNKKTPIFIEKQKYHYWWHNVNKVYVLVNIKAFGYETIVLRPKETKVKEIEYPPLYERTMTASNYFLENELIKVEFDDQLQPIKFLKNGINYLKNARFSLLIEDGTQKMSSWLVGDFRSQMVIKENARIIDYSKNHLFSSLKYEVEFNESKILIEYLLKANSDLLEIRFSVDFYEKGIYGISTPNLSYIIEPNYEIIEARYKTPFGFIGHKSKNQDVASQGIIYGVNNGLGLALYAKNKYGFRFNNNKLQVSLLRASTEPDNLPEYGTRVGQLALQVIENDEVKVINNYNEFVFETIVTPVKKQCGDLKLNNWFYKVNGSVITSSIYEKDNYIYMRFYNPTDVKQEFNVMHQKRINNAEIVDLNDIVIDRVNYNENNMFTIGPNSFLTIRFS